METAGKLIDDEELREAMKESGLGTPATRAETIETLIRREYIERGGKDLLPTPKGLQVITMLEEHPLTSPELTGDWEKRLTDIEHGEDDRAKFIGDIAEFTRATVEKIAELDKEKLRPERVELGLCPRCGAETGEIIRENSKAYGCTSWKSREETGLRLRHLEARRGPHADPRARAPAARGGQDEGRHLRLSLTCRQTFSRAPRLERGGQGGVRLSRSSANQRGRCRGIARARTALGAHERSGGTVPPGQSRTIVLQCERIGAVRRLTPTRRN